MGILDSLRVYRGKWEESGRQSFSQAELGEVSSVCFLLKNGGMKFMPVSNTSKPTQVGDNVDLSRAEVITLSREGDDDIQRIEIK